MRLTNTRDLGLYIRDRRRVLGWSQTQLATAARVSRRWLSALEAGKETAHVGLVFQTLGALGLTLDAQQLEVDRDLEQLLDRHVPKRNERP